MDPARRPGIPSELRAPPAQLRRDARASRTPTTAVTRSREAEVAREPGRRREPAVGKPIWAASLPLDAFWAASLTTAVTEAAQIARLDRGDGTRTPPGDAPRSVGQAGVVGEDRQLHPVRAVELDEQVRHVGLHRGLAHEEGGADLGVRQATPDLGEDLALAR